MFKFFKRLFRPSLYSQVMAVVRNAIADAEDDYNDEVDRLQAQLEEDKEAALKRAVSSVTSRFN